MLIYEVNIESRFPDFRSDEFDRWLKQHIEEMEALEGFLPGTQIFRVQAEGYSVSVHYRLESQQAMDNYFKEHAEEMRSRLPEELKRQLVFSRRILTA